MDCVLCEETELTDRGKIIGVTGGIACGMSTVCQLLAQKGAFVIDLDKVGHQLLVQQFLMVMVLLAVPN